MRWSLAESRASCRVVALLALMPVELRIHEHLAARATLLEGQTPAGHRVITIKSLRPFGVHCQEVSHCKFLDILSSKMQYKKRVPGHRYRKPTQVPVAQAQISSTRPSGLKVCKLQVTQQPFVLPAFLQLPLYFLLADKDSKHFNKHGHMGEKLWV